MSSDIGDGAGFFTFNQDIAQIPWGCFVFETEHLNVSKGEFITKELLWDDIYKECECPR